MEGGWKPREWFAFQFDWTYNHVFERTQPKGAPFLGATVRNIGPDIGAKVKWDYFTFNVILTSSIHAILNLVLCLVMNCLQTS